MKICLFFVLFFVFLSGCKEEKNEKDIMKEKNVLGLDVRSLEEFQATPSVKSRHIPINELQGRALQELKNKNQPIAVFCEAGGRASQAEKLLRSMGFTQVSNIGSWREWNSKIKVQDP